MVPSSLSTLSTFSLWSRCSDYLHDELPAQQFDTWIKPLHVDGVDSDLAELGDRVLTLQAPNRFIKNWVASKFQSRLSELARLLSDGEIDSVRLDVGGTLSSSLSVKQAQATQHTELPSVAPLETFAAVDSRPMQNYSSEALSSTNIVEPQ